MSSGKIVYAKDLNKIDQTYDLIKNEINQKILDAAKNNRESVSISFDESYTEKIKFILEKDLIKLGYFCEHSKDGLYAYNNCYTLNISWGSPQEFIADNVFNKLVHNCSQVDSFDFSKEFINISDSEILHGINEFNKLMNQGPLKKDLDREFYLIYLGNKVIQMTQRDEKWKK